MTSGKLVLSVAEGLRVASGCFAVCCECFEPEQGGALLGCDGCERLVEAVAEFLACQNKGGLALLQHLRDAWRR